MEGEIGDLKIQAKKTVLTSRVTIIDIITGDFSLSKTKNWIEKNYNKFSFHTPEPFFEESFSFMKL